jgi:hypothetical protein
MYIPPSIKETVNWENKIDEKRIGVGGCEEKTR